MAKKAGEESTAGLIARDAADGVKNLYIFAGTEDYFKIRALETFRKVLFPNGGEEFNYIRLNGNTDGEDTLTEAVESYPMFADRKLVVVEDFDASKMTEIGKKKEHVYARTIRELPDYVCLILLCTDGTAAKKSLGDAFTRIEKDARGRYMDFIRPNDAELVQLVSVILLEAGRDINPDDALWLVTICAGTDVIKLVEETKKLAGNGGARVTRREIDAVVSPSPAAVVFDLTNAVTRGETAKAVRLYRLLVERGEEVLALLALISSNLRRMYAVRLCCDDGMTAQEIAAEVGISEKAAAFISRTCKNLDLRVLRRLVLACAEADVDIKSTGADAAITAELLIIRLCGGFGG